MRLRTAAWLLLAIALVAAACGDGSTDAADTAGAAPQTTAPTDTMTDDTMDDDAMEDMDDDGHDQGDDHDNADDDEDGEDHDHGDGHDHGDTVEAASDIGVSIDVTENADGSYTVAIATTGFTFDEAAVDGEHVDGVGHAHIYVDGEKLGRVFGDTYLLDPLEPGEHQVLVELNSNDHRPYTSGGLAIQDVATVVVAGETSAADVVIELDVAADGSVAGETRFAASLGDTVTIRVTSEVTDELHLHGYDLFADLEAGEEAELTFTADVPGIFEAELEGSGLELLRIEVS